MEKIPTPESVLKIFHRIATVDGGYIPVEESDETKDDGITTADKSLKQKNNNKRHTHIRDNKKEKYNKTEEKNDYRGE